MWLDRYPQLTPEAHARKSADRLRKLAPLTHRKRVRAEQIPMRCPRCDRYCDGCQSSPDFEATDHGSIWLLRPLSSACAEWLEEHVEHGPRFGGALAVEHRYIGPILEGLIEEGFRAA